MPKESVPTVLGFDTLEKVSCNPSFDSYSIRGSHETDALLPRVPVNSESLEVSYMHLADSKSILAYFLTNSPSSMFPIFDAIALEVILLFYPLYTRIHAEVHVRITEVPTAFTLRDLRQVHLDALVRVTGVVTRRGGVMPQLKYVKFDCGKCGEVLGPFHQDATKEVKISFCSSCSSKGPFTVNSEQVSLFSQGSKFCAHLGLRL